jgi:hypothetical protein
LSGLFHLRSGADGILAQARDWEMKGEHTRAIDMYLKVTPNTSDDTDAMANAWEKVQGHKHFSYTADICHTTQRFFHVGSNHEIMHDDV